MDKTIPFTLGRFMALVMIGVGALSILIMLFMLWNVPAQEQAQAQETVSGLQDFSAVPTEVNYPAPDLSLQDLDGSPVSLRDYLGSVVLVNLWATWCPPCKEEMPALVSFYEKYKPYGFVLVAINQEEPFEIVEPFVRDYGLTFPVWLDLEYLAEQKFNTMNLPSSYVIDRAGVVRLMWIGGISSGNLEKYVPGIIYEN
jgi:peroxiredoxin